LGGEVAGFFPATYVPNIPRPEYQQRGTRVAAVIIMRALLATLLVCAGTARADGVYFHQQIGVGQAESPLLDKTIQTRAGIGARVRWIAIEAWAASDTQPEREGALFGIVGGEPRMKSDLASYGVATRLIMPLHRTDKLKLEGYARFGAGLVEATGQLDGFDGHTLIGGGGLQVTGRVRALGFAWAPLFFMKKGPYVNGALFVDYGYERMELGRADRVIRSGVNHLALGFAIGTAF
jgi:hypothetical protein